MGGLRFAMWDGCSAICDEDGGIGDLEIKQRIKAYLTKGVTSCILQRCPMRSLKMAVCY